MFESTDFSIFFSRYLSQSYRAFARKLAFLNVEIYRRDFFLHNLSKRTVSVTTYPITAPLQIVETNKLDYN